MTTITYHTKDVAKLIRLALRNRWPAVKFQVRCQRGTASSWIHVNWTDGPTEHQVTGVVSQFEGRRFNGMTDGYDTIPSPLSANSQGDIIERRYYCDGINTNRDLSDGALAVSLLYFDQHDRPFDHWMDARQQRRCVAWNIDMTTSPPTYVSRF